MENILNVKSDMNDGIYFIGQRFTYVKRGNCHF